MIFLLLEHTDFFTNRYDFTPNDYGPYSQELQSDIDYLIKEGHITERRKTIEEGKIKYTYSITNYGMSFVNNIILNEKWDTEFHFSMVLELTNKIKDELNHKDLYSLLSEIYSKYPEYAKHSKFQY